MKIIINFLLAILFVSQGLSAQTLTQKIDAAFSKFKQDEQLKYASFSLTVLNTQTGAIVFEHQKTKV